LFRVISLAATVCVMAVSALYLLGVPPARGATTSIEVGNLYFCSASFSGAICETTVTAGDTVTWNNVAGFHTVTECDDSFSTCPPPGGFDSGTLEPDDSFSHTFTSAGVFEYHCTFHPSAMRGRIVVQAVTPTPTPAATPTPAGSTQAATTAPAASPAPASVPRTGGDPGGSPEGGPASSALIAAGAALIAAAGFLATRGMRQSR